MRDIVRTSGSFLSWMIAPLSVSVNVNAAGTNMLSIHVQCDSSNRFQKSSHEPAATCTTLRLSDGLSILRRTSSSQIAMTVLT